MSEHAEASSNPNLDEIIAASRQAIVMAQDLGYLPADPRQIEGEDLYDVLEQLARQLFSAPANDPFSGLLTDGEDIDRLREQIEVIRDLSEDQALPFFNVGVTTDEDGNLVFPILD